MGLFNRSVYQVHTGHHDQCKEERKNKTEDDRPAQWAPEYHTVTAKENIGPQVLEQSHKINIKTDRQWQ
jgi:hypothetical protein